ncbi:MAG: flagellar basal body P-ring formation chaperone FlgA [Syntrophomonadaceae bacterium]
MKILYLLFFLVFSFQTTDTLKEEIEKFLAKKITGLEKIEFEIASKPVSPAGGTIKVDTLKDLKITGGLAYIPVIVTTKDQAVSQSFVSLKLSLYKKVLVSKKPLAIGSELKADDFELKTLDVAKLRGVPVCEIKEIMGTRAKFNIREGEALISEKLQAMPVVKRGDSVRAFELRGNVEISMDATARQDGSIGEVIRVLTSDKKIFRARVIDQFSVNIIE